jgi:hypothetical protein
MKTFKPLSFFNAILNVTSGIEIQIYDEALQLNFPPSPTSLPILLLFFFSPLNSCAFFIVRTELILA